MEKLTFAGKAVTEHMAAVLALVLREDITVTGATSGQKLDPGTAQRAHPARPQRGDDGGA
jgi:hypothetical protein